MEVPATTAESVRLNKLIREKLLGEARCEDDFQRWRNPPAPAPDGGGSGVWRGKAAMEAHERRAKATILSSPEVFGYSKVRRGSRKPPFERTSANLHSGMRWEQIVKVWEVSAGGIENLVRFEIVRK